MAKRFTDTNKYKKPFVRGLKGAYKLFWDFLYHDCDHAGIWIVDFEIAQFYIGLDMPVNKTDALHFFNETEQRIIELGGGKKWFIPSFIEFQYGQLSEKNRAHVNVISVLKKYNLIDEKFNIKKGDEGASKPLTRPLQGAKEKEQEQEMEKEKETEQDFGKSENLLHNEKRKREPEKLPPEKKLSSVPLDAQPEPQLNTSPNPKKKSMPKIFRESEWFDKEKLTAAIEGTQYEAANVGYYYEVMLNWSDSKGEKKIDWLATCKNWMARDMTEGKFITKNFRPNERNTKTATGGNVSTGSLFAKIASMPD